MAPGPETQEFHAQMLKLASKPEWILPNVLHVSRSSGQTMLQCIPPGRRIGRGAAVCRMFRRPLDLQVGVSTLMCLSLFVVCSEAGDGKRRGRALDRPLFEL